MKKLTSTLTIFFLIVGLNLSAQSKIEKLFYQGDFQEALQLIENEIEVGDMSVVDYQIAAKCHEKLFDFKSAINNYEKALVLSPNEASLHEGLCDAFNNLGMKKEALLSIERANALNESNSRLLGKKGVLLMENYKYEEAENVFETLFMADSSNVFFMRKLMQSRYKRQKYSYVIDLWWGNLLFPYENKEMTLMVADCFMKINENPQALGLLYGILELDSTYIPALSKTAYIHFNTYRNYEDAVQYYRTLNRVEKESNPNHMKNWAICEFFTGNQEFAAVTLDSLSKIVSDDPFIPFYAGLSYKKLGNVDKALVFLENASAMLIPGYTSDVYHHLGRAYAAKRMFDEALTTYKKVREYDPHNYQVLYDMAVTYEEYNLNRTMALGYYQQFVKECTNMNSSDLKYAENRISWIKEELFFEGD